MRPFPFKTESGTFIFPVTLFPSNANELMYFKFSGNFIVSSFVFGTLHSMVINF